MRVSIVFLALVVGLAASKSPGEDRPEPNASAMLAFTTWLSTRVTILEEFTLIFDHVETNVGDLYYPTSGQFVCPDGLYVFMWSIEKTADTDVGMQCVTQLRKGGVGEKYGPKTSYYSTTYSGTTEMMAVLPCTTSSPAAVTVVSESWSDTNPISEYNTQKTSFSGFRLQSDTAFTVELSTDIILSDRGRIPFDHVLHNFGDSYDVTNGYFKCPDDGIYVFSVSTYTTDPSTPWSVSRLMKEREVVLEGPITYRATSSYDSGSSSITSVLQCSTGHSIYVEAQAAHDFPYNSYAPTLTSFTGFKLYDATAGYAAFSAVMTNNLTITSGDDIVFVFDKVISNIGGAYNPTTGEFVCPDDGFYAFTWSATANIGSIQVLLYMDGTHISHVYLTPSTSGDATGTTGTSTKTVIKQCSAGIVVQIQGATASSTRVFLGGYNAFSGYRIPGTM